MPKRGISEVDQSDKIEKDDDNTIAKVTKCESVEKKVVKTKDEQGDETMECDSEEQTNKKQPSKKKSDKKQRTFFSGAEIRDMLYDEKTQVEALEYVCENCNFSFDKCPVAAAYIEAGGNCLELLQLLEVDTTFTLHLIIKFVNHLIYQIIAHHKDHKAATEEACQYFLNTHLETINSLLNQGSMDADKVMILNLFVAMVTLSSYLATHIIQNVHIQVHLLIKHGNALINLVRSTYIKFIMAFFAHGYGPAVVHLVNKQYFFENVAPGLRYDPVNEVQLVLKTLHDEFINNEQVPKPVKVQFFSQGVLRSFVTLYDWLGPKYLSRARTATPTNDEVKKRKDISDLVHQCLLPLCSSFKYGLVFRNNNLGYGKSYGNQLMHAVVNAVFQTRDPWTAVEPRHLLAVHIASTCYDVVKTIWTRVLAAMGEFPKPEWRFGMQMITAVVRKLEPHGGQTLTPTCYAQAVQALVAPTALLQKLFPSEFNLAADADRQCIIEAIHAILEACQRFIRNVRTEFPKKYAWTLTTVLREQIAKHMPTGSVLMGTWLDHFDTIDVEQQQVEIEHMRMVIKILGLYHDLCPNLLIDLKLGKIQSLFMKNISVKNFNRFQAEYFELLYTIEPMLFSVETEHFRVAVKFFSHNVKKSKQIFVKILSTTGYFSESPEEIEIWIRGFPKQIECIILYVKQNYLELIEELRTIHAAVKEEDTASVEHVIRALSADAHSSSTIAKRLRTVKCSLFTLGALKMSFSPEDALNLGTVLTHIFHLQTSIEGFQSCIKQNREKIPRDVYKYICKWPKHSDPISDIAGIEAMLQLSRAMFTLVHSEKLVGDAYEEVLKLAKAHAAENLDLIYCNPSILKGFCSSEKPHIRKFILELTDYLKTTDVQFEAHLKTYQNKLYSLTMEMFKNQATTTYLQQYSKILDTIGMGYAECAQILQHLTKLPVVDYLNEEGKPNNIYNVTVTILNNFATYTKSNIELEPFEGIAQVAAVLAGLNRKNIDSPELADAIRGYFERFPHQVSENREELSEVFTSVALKQEYCKANAKLALYLFRYTNGGYLKEFATNISEICSKKGLILPILDVLMHHKGFDNKMAAETFEHVLPLVTKTLQKPQKAGQHFEKHYNGLCHLIKQYMPTETAVGHMNKIHKFDTSEIFFIAMIKAMYSRTFKEKPNMANATMTFVHFIIAHLKNQVADDSEEAKMKLEKLERAVEIFKEFLNEGYTFGRKKLMKLDELRSNQTFTLFWKLCLKHGISSNKHFLIDLLRVLMKMLKYTSEEATEILDMMISHSEFQNIVINVPSKAKDHIFHFMLTLCQMYPGVMKPPHVPLLLASYTATLHPSDRKLLRLLTVYSEASPQTFNNFRPIIWGVTATNYYSLRQDSHRALFRQPRTGDILDILQPEIIFSTILNFPLATCLYDSSKALVEENGERIYDVGFLFPQLTQLLAAENRVYIHRVTRSGVLAIVAIALSASNREVRLAAIHIFMRFHTHLLTGRVGKDQVIWLRYVEALVKGTGVIENFRLNNFAANFMAQTALVISNPQEEMYMALTNFIGVKSTPKLTTIPELYTFLYSADVHHVQYRQFILQVLIDGMRNDADVEVAIRTAAFRLIMEIYSSPLPDQHTRHMILEVFERATRLPNGVEKLCISHGLLAWLLDIVQQDVRVDTLKIISRIYANILKSGTNIAVVKISYHYIIDHCLHLDFDDESKLQLLKSLLQITLKDKTFLNLQRLESIVQFSGSDKSTYILRYKVKACSHIQKQEDDKNIDEVTQRLVQSWLDS